MATNVTLFVISFFLILPKVFYQEGGKMSQAYILTWIPLHVTASRMLATDQKKIAWSTFNISSIYRKLAGEVLPVWQERRAR